MPFEKLPGTTATPYDYLWMDSIQPYVKSDQIFNCPSMSFGTGTAIQPYSSTATRSNGNKTLGSYAINITYCRDDAGLGYIGTPVSYSGQNGGSVQTIKNSAIDTPATTVFAADSIGDEYGTGTRTYYLSWYQIAAQGAVGTLNGMKTFGNAGKLIERHLETTNVLWMDGHVKAMKIDALADKRSSGVANGVTYLFTRQDD